MYEQVGRLAEVAAFQHCWPEQAVEVNDVFTDEVIQLGIGIFLPVFVEAYGVAALVTQILEGAHVANRRIQPDVEIFARRVRDFEAKVWRIAGDIPLLQTGFEPLLHFVRDLLLQCTAAGPCLQHFAERRQVEEEVLGVTHHRGFTFRTGAFNETVRQEHAFFRIVQLRNGAVFNETVLFQTGVDQL